MKIRLGFGVTGNQGINPYATFSDYSQIIDYAKALIYNRTPKIKSIVDYN